VKKLRNLELGIWHLEFVDEFQIQNSQFQIARLTPGVVVRSRDTRMTTVPHGSEPGKRLVVLAPNWLGDAVMALPAIADVRRARPGSVLAVAARPAIMPLFTLAEGIDTVLDVSVSDLAAHRFDEALLLPNSFRSALIAWRAGIAERWGYRTQGRGALLTRAVSRGARGHQAAYYQSLVADLGFPNGPMRPTLAVSSPVRQASADLLCAAGWDGRTPLVAFAPGSSNGRAKQWPPESFAGVARGLARDGIASVLIGTRGDGSAGAEILRELGNAAAFDLVGRTELPALAGVLANCRAFVGNDSGAMHLAAALGVRVIAMFGPSNEAETRPLGAASTYVLTHDVWCRPCMLRECPLDHGCMRGITPERVLEAARSSVAGTAWTV
jgi:heptosyltransferase-2